MQRIRNWLMINLMVGMAGWLLLGSAGLASAAVNPPRAPTSTAIVSPQSITYSWTTSTPGGTESSWVVSKSTDGINFTIVALLSPTSSQSSYTFTGLATNTQYWFRVAGNDGVASSSAVTSSPVWTKTATPTAFAFSLNDPHSVWINFNSALNSNPQVNTGFIVRDFTTSSGFTYLQANLTSWGAAPVRIDCSFLSCGGATLMTAFNTNTIHNFAMATVNGDSTATSSYGPTTTFWTQAATPNGFTSVVGNAVNQLTVTMAADTNPATGTGYIVRDQYYNASGNFVGTQYLSSNGGSWSSNTTTYTGGIMSNFSLGTNSTFTTNTKHVLSVAAVNGDSSATTSYSNTTDAFTAVATPGAPLATAVEAGSGQLYIGADAGTVGSNPSYASTTFKIYAYATGTPSQTLNSDQTWAHFGSGSFTYAQLSPYLLTSQLSANTQYDIVAVAINGDGSSVSAQGPSTTLYTGADVPTISATVDSQTQITVTLSGTDTQYILYNNTLNTNTGYGSQTTFTYTGLTCGTTYNFQSRGKNGNGVTTALSGTTSATTQSCGGGGVAVQNQSQGGVIVPLNATQLATLKAAQLPIVGPAAGQNATSGGSATSPAVVNVGSSVTFTLPAVSVIQPGKPLKYTYTFTPDKKETVTIERQTLDAKGKVLTRISTSKTVQPTKPFVFAPNQTIGKKTGPGTYAVKIIIRDSKKKVLDQNGFNFTVVK